MYIKNIVISLQSAIDRRKHIESEFGKHKVAFEFFDALTPDTAKEHAKMLSLNLNAARLTPGELACMTSHVSIWQKVIAENIPYVAIFEDDVYLGEDAESLLNNTEWIKPDWNIIKIEAFAKKALLSTTKYSILSDKRQIVPLKGKNLGAAGYILSTKGAKLLLDYISNRKLQPVDEIIFDIFISQQIVPVYQMLPALCVQEMILKERQSVFSLPSSLERERRDRMRSEKKSGLAKIRREANRLMLQAKEALFATEIAFK